jgi:uncharacterized small protein (DUF1192 family)
MATDQEQTERGASTDVEAETSAFAARVVGDLEAEVETHRQQLTNVTRLVGYWQAEIERLRADLARVTAERDRLGVLDTVLRERRHHPGCPTVSTTEPSGECNCWLARR